MSHVNDTTSAVIEMDYRLANLNLQDEYYVSIHAGCRYKVVVVDQPYTFKSGIELSTSSFLAPKLCELFR